MRCFRKTLRRSIDNAQPMLEIFYVTSYQCIDQCIFATNNNAPNARLCRSFIYDRSQHSCRLYDHDGNRPPSILHPADGYDYYKRTAVLNQCSGPVAPTSSSLFIQRPSNPNPYALKVMSTGGLPWRSQTYSSASSERSEVQIVERRYEILNSGRTRMPYQRKADGSKQLSRQLASKQFGDKIKEKGPEQLNTYSSFANDRTQDSSSEAVHRWPNQPIIFADSESEFDYKTSRNPVLVAPRKLITTASPTVDNELISEAKLVTGGSLRSQCSTSIGYYVAIGSELNLPASSEEYDVTIVEGVTQSQCARYCSANERPNGESIKCFSMNYFPLSQKCGLYSALARPHGRGTLVENDDVIYYEKFCLPVENANCHENEMFILHANKKLACQELHVLSASSITMCLRHCLEHEQCKSAAYDANNGRCYLYDVNAADSPSTIKDTTAGWVVIENGCSAYATHEDRRNSFNDSEDMVTLREAQWTEWSDCQFRLHGRLVRSRTRRCEAECGGGGLQVEPCD